MVLGMNIADWLNLTIRGLIIWAVIIPIFALIGYFFPNLHIGVRMAIGFMLAIVTSALTSKWNINIGHKLKEKYDAFLGRLNKKIWKEKNGEKCSCTKGN